VLQLSASINRRAVALLAVGVLSGGVLSVMASPAASATSLRPMRQQAGGAPPPVGRRVVVHRTKAVKVGDVSDSFVSFTHPTFHPGSLDRLSAVDGYRHHKIVYVKFRVSGLPADAQIKQADLRFTRQLHHMPATTLRLYRVSSTRWTQARLDARNRPHAGRRLATVHVGHSARKVSFPIHHLTLKAGHSYSFAVTAADRKVVTRFKSRESGGGPDLGLVVTVPVIVTLPVGPKPNPTPTPTPTTSASPTPNPSTSDSPTPDPTGSASPTPTASPTQAPTTTPTPAPTNTPVGPPTTGPNNCALSALLVPSCGVLLGGYLTSFGGAGNVDTALNDFDSDSGSQVSVDHDYLRPGQTLSAGDVAAAQTPNKLLLVNWKPTNTWADGDGSDAGVNAQIDAMANSVKALGNTKIFLTIFHEPENDVSGGATGCPSTVYKGSAGTPADYRAMWANVEARFAALNVTNVVWTMNYMGYGGWQCMVDDLWPGNSLVDWILWDPYSSDNLTYSQTVKTFYNELTTMSDASHNYLSKPWGLGEFGDRSTSTANQDQFFSTVAQSLNSNEYPKLKLLTLFDAQGNTGDYRVAYDQGVWDPKKIADLKVLDQDASIVGGRQSVAGG
jgi:hypothetical protein